MASIAADVRWKTFPEDGDFFMAGLDGKRRAEQPPRSNAD
jgi:hypothetical protein